MSKLNLNRLFRGWFGGSEKSATGTSGGLLPRGGSMSAGARFRMLESLEARQMLSVNIVFDYSLDTGGFFAQQLRRDVLQAAANAISSRLNDSLDAISPGGANQYNLDIFDPSDIDSVLSLPNVAVPANTILIYAGSASFGDGTLGVGGPAGYSGLTGSQSFFDAVQGRGEPGALVASPSDFATAGGSLTFDRETPWYFNTSASGLSADTYDFYSVATHEIGHVLGIGTADSWHNLISGSTFLGAQSKIANSGVSPQVTPADGNGHWASGTTSNGQEAAMTPTIADGQRKVFTQLDFAALDDIGWDLQQGLDFTAPTVTINQADGQNDPAGDTPVLFTVIFNEPVTNFTASDINLSASTAPGTLVATVVPLGDGYTFTVQVTGMTGSGTVTASIPEGAAFDTSGNPSKPSTSTDNQVTFDADAFKVTINQGANITDPTSGAVVFDVVFNHPTTNFATGDVDFTGSSVAGTLVGTVVGLGDGMHYTVTVTGMVDSGTIVANIPAGIATDSNGRNNLDSTTLDNSITYDVTSPTVTIDQAANQLDPTKSSTIYFTVVFSETVIGFTTTDISLVGSTAVPDIGDLAVSVTGSGPIYTVAITGMSQTGTVIVSIPAGAVSDAAGNLSLASSSSDNTVTYDVTPPTVVVNQGDTQNDPTNTPNASSTGSVGPEVNQGTTIDNDINDPLSTGYFGVTIGNGGSVSDSTLTAEGRTQIAEIQNWFSEYALWIDTGTNVFKLQNTTITSPATLIAPDTVSSSGTFQGPNGIVQWTVVSNFVNGGSAFTNRLSFSSSEAFGSIRVVSYLDADILDDEETNVVSTIGTPGDQDFRAFILGKGEGVGLGQGGVYFNSAGPDNVTNATFLGWTADDYFDLEQDIISRSASYSINGVINFPSSTDIYGRVNYGPGDAATAFAWSLNPAGNHAAVTTKVGVQATDISYDPGNEAVKFTAVFSEPVINFYPSAISFTGSTVPGTLVASIIPFGDGRTFTISVTGMTGDGLVVVSLPAGAATDPALNSSLASVSVDNSVTFDISKPTVTLSTDADLYTSLSPIPVTVTFSEAVSGFTIDDLQITNASVTDGFISGSGTTYTFTLTPTAQGEVSVAIGAGAAFDEAGNGSFESSTLKRTFDTTTPTVTINQALVQSDPAFFGSIIFTAAFSEPIDGLNEADIVLSGTAVPSTRIVSISGDGPVFTVTVQGVNSVGTLSASILAGSVTDRAGNANLASTSTDNTVTIRNPAPTIDNLVPASDHVTVGRVLPLTLQPTVAGSSPVTDGKFPVAAVNFYRDANNDGILQPDRDVLVATDTNGADGWGVNLNTTGFPVGETTFFARADDEHGGLSNIASAPVTLYRTVASDRTGKASYYDAAGKLVTVSITGPGTFDVDFLTTETRANAGLIAVFGSTNKTTLTVTTKNNAATDIGAFVVGNPQDERDRTSIRSIAARNANITEGVIITGTTTSLGFGNVSDALIKIGPGPSPVDTVALTFGQLENVDIESRTAIKTFTAVAWREDGGTDNLSAPWITALNITGHTASNTRGDFQASISLTSTAVATSLGTFTVAGELRSSEVRAANGIGTVKLGTMVNSTLFSGVKSDVTGLPTTSANFAQTANSFIRALTITSTAPEAFAGSNVSAYKFGNIKLTTVKTANGGTPFGLASAFTSPAYRGPASSGDFVVRGLASVG